MTQAAGQATPLTSAAAAILIAAGGRRGPHTARLALGWRELLN
jgi:hypothetical protein